MYLCECASVSPCVRICVRQQEARRTHVHACVCMCARILSGTVTLCENYIFKRSFGCLKLCCRNMFLAFYIFVCESMSILLVLPGQSR